MSTNNSFSFSRLGLVMKRDWMENWKTNLYVFIGIYGAYLVSYLVSMDMYSQPRYLNNAYLEASYFKSHSGYFAFIAAVLLIYFAAQTMRNMKNKESRLAYLMLPATSLEKFVARVLYATAGVIGMIIAASSLAEVTHFVFIPFFEGFPEKLHLCVWPYAWGNIWEAINPFNVTMRYYSPVEGEYITKTIFWRFALAYSAALWFHSLFILGGNYFTKYPFVKTCGVIILSSIVLGYLLSHLDGNDFVWFENFVRQNEDWLTEELAAGVMAVITFCFTIFNWCLAYRCFTRQQVIKPKFRLL